ncbi:MAG: hypothetical protein J6O71_00135 [Lachnospiraceae bacterium]|nr:hypothetical protein [Lachnospiraceae bacterium]
MNKTRTLLIRICVIVVLGAICALMFVIGRGHTVYFDNKSMDYNGQTIETPYKIEVYVGDERVAKLYDGERGMAKWMGQNFKMVVETTKEKGGEASASAVSLKLPYEMDGVVLNVPALFAGLPQEAYLTQFVPTAAEEEAMEETEEEMVDEFGITQEEGAETEAVPE